jgi:hypothetical protein
MNHEVLATSEAIARWRELRHIGAFIKYAIAAAQFDDNRARPRGVEWETVSKESPVSALLLQLPLYKWPVPRNHGCFHPNCDHQVAELQSSHLQRAHDRKRMVRSEEKSKLQRIWNGESTLQATMADLLKIWSVAKAGAKYCNPYAGNEEKRIGTFKALAETWNLPEVRDFHKHLGDFWGPIVIHLRKHKTWMPVGDAFNTGSEHGFCLMTREEMIENWRRGGCVVSKDSPVYSTFKAVLDEIKPAYAHSDYVVPSFR